MPLFISYPPRSIVARLLQGTYSRHVLFRTERIRIEIYLLRMAKDDDTSADGDEEETSDEDFADDEEEDESDADSEEDNEEEGEENIDEDETENEDPEDEDFIDKNEWNDE
jgi:hypothetical protein